MLGKACKQALHSLNREVVNCELINRLCGRLE